jgi:hypothetical protein
VRILFFIISFFQVFSLFAANNDSLIATKYWNYRVNLHRDFVAIGEGKGRSICAAGRVVDGKRMSLYYGDNITYHGWYVGMLATEYALLKRQNLTTEFTLLELYYALKAVDRLDSVAETLFKDQSGNYGKASLNGFFVRDDVDQDQKKLFPGIDYVYSDYLLGLSTPDRLQSDNEMSQDQAIHLLLGLRLVQHFVDENAAIKNIKIREFAINQGLRIIKWIGKDKWIVKNPVTQNPVYRGPDARLFSYAFYKVAQQFSNGHLHADFPHYTSSSPLGWGLLQTGFVPVHFNRAMIMILATAGNSWINAGITNYCLSWYDVLWQKQVFPLIHAELNNVKTIHSTRISRVKIQKLLLEADSGGIFTLGNYGWNTSNRWLASHYKYKTYDGFHAQRQNTGLDFMILCNLYFLRFGQDIPENYIPHHHFVEVFNQRLKN